MKPLHYWEGEPMFGFGCKKIACPKKTGDKRVDFVGETLARAHEIARNTIPISGSFEFILDLPADFMGPQEIVFGLLNPDGIMFDLAREAPKYGLEFVMVVNDTTAGFTHIG